MVNRTLTYKVDLYDYSNRNLGYISKNDTTVLILELQNTKYNIDYIKVTILGKRSDGKLIEQKDNEDIVKENGTITIKLKKQFTNVIGIINLNIKLEDKEGSITEIEPYFYVNSTIEGDIVEDNDTIDTLNEIRDLAQRVEDKLNEIPEGNKGSIWRPSVSEDGLLSWTEDNSNIPPESVNIKGEQGIPGLNGRDGVDGKQGIPGENGITPHIGDNDNWFIGTQDTGVPARGKDGKQGEPGRDGEIGPQGPPGKDGVLNEEQANLLEEISRYIEDNSTVQKEIITLTGNFNIKVEKRGKQVILSVANAATNGELSGSGRLPQWAIPNENQYGSITASGVGYQGVLNVLTDGNAYYYVGTATGSAGVYCGQVMYYID